MKPPHTCDPAPSASHTQTPMESLEEVNLASSLRSTSSQSTNTHMCFHSSLEEHRRADETQTRTSNNDEVPSSEPAIAEDLDLHPDSPLSAHNEVMEAHTRSAAEPYTPWLGSDKEVGIIPMFGCLVFVVPITPLLVLPVFIALSVIVQVIWWYETEIQWLREPISVSFIRVTTALVIFLPVFCVFPILLAPGPRAHKWRNHRRAGVVFFASLFGFFSWGYCALVMNTNTSYQYAPNSIWDNSTTRQLLQAWSTGTIPLSSQGCDVRVEPQQAPLFLADLYNTQFARTKIPVGNETFPISLYPAFDLDQSRSIQSNQTLCDKGFAGNVDLYGLGIRTGLYTQWISSLLANNFLSSTRQELRKVYLIFSVVICIVTVIVSLTKACVFGIEIEIVYWMYWGGFACVFATSPCPLQLGAKSQWVPIDWNTVVLFMTHTLMTYHGTWFALHAYDQVFARNPCGTYHFFLVPILDPSESFWVLRDYLGIFLFLFVHLIILFFPLLSLLLASEVKYTLQHSAIYQSLCSRADVPSCDQDQGPNDGVNVSRVILKRWRAYRWLREWYSDFREHCHLPSHSRGGIRLVTPLDIKQRRLYRIKWATIGLGSCLLAIAAIETTLKWNKITGVYSITSTGQYVPLMIGVGSFVSVCWKLIHQEGERRLHLRRRKTSSEYDEGIELETLTSHSFADAISHAFAQPDTDFLSNSGALPHFHEDFVEFPTPSVVS